MPHAIDAVGHLILTGRACVKCPTLAETFHGLATASAARALAASGRAHTVATNALPYAVSERAMDALAISAVRASDAANVAWDTAVACERESDPARAAWLSGLTQDACELAQDFCDETLRVAERIMTLYGTVRA